MTFMTARPRDLGELICCTPYLLGYQPGACVILVVLDGVRGVLTHRTPLVPPGRARDGEPPLPQEVADGLRWALRHTRGRHAVLLGFEGSPGQSSGVMRGVAAVCDAEDVRVDELAVVRAGRWWHVPPGASGVEGPAAGWPVPDPADVPAVAPFVRLGVAPVMTREEVFDSFEVERGDHDAVRRRVGAARQVDVERLTRPGVDRAAQVRAGLLAWRRVLGLGAPDAPGGVRPLVEPDLSTQAVASAVVALDDPSLRDLLGDYLTGGVWLHGLPASEPVPQAVALGPAPWRHHPVTELGTDVDVAETPLTGPERAAFDALAERLARLVTHVPSSLEAGVLTELALLHWAAGSAVVARAAAQRAAELQPSHSLAQSVWTLLVNGHGPRWYLGAVAAA